MLEIYVPCQSKRDILQQDDFSGITEIIEWQDVFLNMSI